MLLLGERGGERKEMEGSKQERKGQNTNVSHQQRRGEEQPGTWLEKKLGWRRGRQWGWLRSAALQPGQPGSVLALRLIPWASVSWSINHRHSPHHRVVGRIKLDNVGIVLETMFTQSKQYIWVSPLLLDCYPLSVLGADVYQARSWAGLKCLYYLTQGWACSERLILVNSYDCVINTNIPEASSISYQKESFCENPKTRG